MARVIIESDDGSDRISVSIRDRENGEDEYGGWCAQHHLWITDRGVFEDTCEAIANHLDNRH
jgi:hypothetical protein